MQKEHLCSIEAGKDWDWTMFTELFQFNDSQTSVCRGMMWELLKISNPKALAPGTQILLN